MACLRQGCTTPVIYRYFDRFRLWCQRLLAGRRGVLGAAGRVRRRVREEILSPKRHIGRATDGCDGVESIFDLAPDDLLPEIANR
jgi:hypothetical protein